MAGTRRRRPAYDRALAETGRGSAKAGLRRALWEEHPGSLLARGALAEAAGVARRYCEAARRNGDPEGELALLLLLGEALATQEAWPQCLQILAEVQTLCQHSPGVLKGDRLPALLRLEGLAAMQRDDPDTARVLLARARDAYRAAGEEQAARSVEQDLQILELDPAGGASAVDALRPAQSIPEILLAARTLRRQGRYEAAAELLVRRLDRDVEPALRFPLLHEIVLLRQILGDRKMMEALLPLLREAAEEAGDPGEARAAIRADRPSPPEGRGTHREPGVRRPPSRRTRPHPPRSVGCSARGPGRAPEVRLGPTFRRLLVHRRRRARVGSCPGGARAILGRSPSRGPLRTRGTARGGKLSASSPGRVAPSGRPYPFPPARRREGRRRALDGSCPSRRVDRQPAGDRRSSHPLSRESPHRARRGHRRHCGQGAHGRGAGHGPGPGRSGARAGPGTAFPGPGSSRSGSARHPGSRGPSGVLALVPGDGCRSPEGSGDLDPSSHSRPALSSPARQWHPALGRHSSTAA